MELTTFLLPLLCHSLVNADNTLVPSQQIITGDVVAGNYTYFKISKPGAAALVLLSYEGDADLYISTGTPTPTFSLDDHQFQSATCGVDHVELPSSISRPLYVGIYGHPSHELSRYFFAITLFEGDNGDDELVHWAEYIKLNPAEPNHWNSVYAEDNGKSFFSVLLHIGEIFSAVMLFLIDNFIELSAF
ncbi:hypothetical protein M514_11494 [Trichuris suis]|uniref:Uncharacterized protein n=1 Tax=Trichuris suis TaxID=68888 RepID=A0A085NS69_9BILA|nr:hypothetical protein M513_11494 [Trichuris suis]KFD72315.1 hypothetical protein M514_11494 [Trichuris suis]KHJ49306.1 hypothetical protein D918_00431 [Trichuris suis]